MQAPKATFARRYPALALVAAAAVLAVLLPSALNVPQSGPSSLAEFAPVPGEGVGRSDASRLGSAASGGLGAGGANSGPAGLLPERAGAPAQRRAQLKRCVGNPPRQTEDPLSPPCVAFFDGNNGGVTTRGVTGDEVTAVIRVNPDSNQADPTDQHAGELIDCGGPASNEDNQEDRNCRIYMRYFNDRYQTYGRQVRLWTSHGVPLGDIDDRLKPFALARGSSGGVSRRGITFISHSGYPRKFYQDNAPHWIGFRPDYEDQAAITASYICLKLKDRSARHAGDPSLRSRSRKLAIWHEGDLNLRNALVRALDEQCGVTGVPEASGAGQNGPTAAANFRNDGVTTVILFGSSSFHVLVTGYATQVGYFPEWMIHGGNGLRGMDTAFYGRLGNQLQWSNAFGVTFDYRRDGLRDQPWFKAYKEGCPTCQEPVGIERSAAAEVYDNLTMLFWGIQAAGPRLNPENFDKGMHAIPPRGSSNPYKPAAYFAPGNYAFIKDAAGIWWSPSESPPGASEQGCYKLPHDGRRFRPGEWLRGDEDVKGEGPCQGDTNQ